MKTKPPSRDGGYKQNFERIFKVGARTIIHPCYYLPYSAVRVSHIELSSAIVPNLEPDPSSWVGSFNTVKRMLQSNLLNCAFLHPSFYVVKAIDDDFLVRTCLYLHYEYS